MTTKSDHQKFTVLVAIASSLVSRRDGGRLPGARGGSGRLREARGGKAHPPRAHEQRAHGAAVRPRGEDPREHAAPEHRWRDRLRGGGRRLHHGAGLRPRLPPRAVALLPRLPRREAAGDGRDPHHDEGAGRARVRAHAVAPGRDAARQSSMPTSRRRTSLVDTDGQVELLDFGIARMRGEVTKSTDAGSIPRQARLSPPSRRWTARRRGSPRTSTPPA